MRNRTKLLGISLSLFALLGLLAVPLPAQQPWVQGQTVSRLVADDEDVAILLRYHGTEASATVEVNASGDILVKHGAESSEAADTTVICPSGGTGGTIDVSNAACDTVGEAVDAINASANWVAVPLDSLRSDTIGTSAVLLDKGPVNAQTSTGVGLEWDTSAKFVMTQALTERRTMNFYANLDGNRYSRPFEDTRAIVHKLSQVSTFASGTSTIQIISVAMENDIETTTTIWEEAGGATTVRKTLDEAPYGFIGRRGEKLLVRVTNSAAMASADIKAYGMEWLYR